MFANYKALVHIKWCNFNSVLTDEFKSLLQTGELSDILIEIVDGSKICAHKIILRSTSEYFRDIFNIDPRSRHIKLPTDAVATKFAILFMYHGEVNILKTDLAAFLEAAKLLRLKGFDAVRISDLGTERDLKINLGQQSDEYLKYMNANRSHPNDFIASTGKRLRKTVKRSAASNNDLAINKFVCKSNSISRPSTSRSCTKSADSSQLSFVSFASSSSSIDFSEYKKAPSPSNDQSSPEIVE